MEIERSDIVLEEVKKPYRYPKKIIISFQILFIVKLMVANAQSQRLYFFQTIMGIDAGIIAIIGLIFVVFNAINDPIIGYLCDKTTKLTKRFGRRFIYILIGTFGYSASLILLFLVPDPDKVGNWSIIIYLFLAYLINDSFMVLFNLNRDSLYAEKFRNIEDRRFGGPWQTIFETIGVLLGFGIPIGLVSILGDVRSSYIIVAFTIFILGIVIIIIGLPGIKEDEKLKKRQEKYIHQEQESFFKGMKQIIKNKHFLGYLFLYSCYFTTMGLIITSVPFFVKDILQLGKEGEFLVGFYILGVFIAIPIWIKIGQKFSIKKIAIYGAFLLAIMGIPFLFIPSGITGVIITIFVYLAAGFADGAVVSMSLPLLSSILDHETIKTGKRREGHFTGVGAFIGSFFGVIPPIIYWAVQRISGYNPERNFNTRQELFGLRVQISLVPLVLMLFGIILFNHLYKLTSEDIMRNSITIEEMEL